MYKMIRKVHMGIMSITLTSEEDLDFSIWPLMPNQKNLVLHRLSVIPIQSTKSKKDKKRCE